MWQAFRRPNGRIELKQVAVPYAGPGQVRVHTRYSALAAPGPAHHARPQPGGTEGRSLLPARLTRRSPAPEGEVEHRPVGRSSSGVVSTDGEPSAGLQPGMAVAWAGAEEALLAEVVVVRTERLVAVPHTVPLEHAAFAGHAAAALHAVRRLEPRLGGTALVVGGSLLGLFAVQLLQAGGCRVVVTAAGAAALEAVQGWGIPAYAWADRAAALHHAERIAAGNGVDVTVLAGGAATTEQLSLAMVATVEGGRVLAAQGLVDAVPAGMLAEKEQALLCNWPVMAEGRPAPADVATALALMADGRLAVAPLITHRYPLSESDVAVRQADSDDGATLGVLVALPTDHPPVTRLPVGEAAEPREDDEKVLRLGVAAEDWGQLVPWLEPARAIGFLRPTAAFGLTDPEAPGKVAEAGLERLESDLAPFLDAVDVMLSVADPVQQAGFAVQALQRERHVLLVPPVVFSAQQLGQAAVALSEHHGARLAVAYTLRFSEAAEALREELAEAAGPWQVQMEVPLGFDAPKGLPGEGVDEALGGMLLAAPYVDLAVSLCDSPVAAVAAQGVADAAEEARTWYGWSLLLTFADGSSASLVFSPDTGEAGGDRITVADRAGVARLERFERLTVHRAGQRRRTRRVEPEGGKDGLFRAWAHALRTGQPLMPFWQVENVALTLLRAAEAMRSGLKLRLDEPEEMPA